MKLLVFTRFYPAVGGLETVMEILAREWTAAGHEVRIATDVPAPPFGEGRPFPYEVHHRPTPGRLLALVKWCDAYVHGCIGLKTLWPLAVYRRLYVATHHTWYRRGDGRRSWQDRLKRWVSRHALNIAPSRAVAADLPTACAVIPNPYRMDIFQRLPGTIRERELIFVGRLVSDKGISLLLQALFGLNGEGLHPRLTIVGDGPERLALERQLADLGLEAQVKFVGPKSPTEVATLLNRHRFLIVPSTWEEPFGVVALEGIACGCIVVGSEKGGLKDAIGPCGVTFRNGNVSALMEQLKFLLRAELAIAGHDAIDDHLARHQPVAIAKKYIDVMLTPKNR